MPYRAFRFRSLIPAFLFSALGLTILFAVIGHIQGELYSRFSDQLSDRLELFCQKITNAPVQDESDREPGFMLVLGPDGAVVRESRTEKTSPRLENFRKELLENRVPVRWLRQSAEKLRLAAEYRSVSLPGGDGKAYAVIDPSAWVKPIQEASAGGIFAILLLGLIAGARSYFSAGKLSETFVDMTAMLERLAAGDAANRLLSDHGKIFHPLTYALTRASERQEFLSSELARFREELDHISSQSPVGILLLDARGMIYRCNPEAGIAAGSELTPGRFYWEFFRDLRFIAMTDRLLLRREEIREEVRLRGKTWACRGSWLSSGRLAVLTLSDTSNARDLEKIKRDFVSNVSHELKTPLTSIRGFTESLLATETDAEKRKQMEIVARNAERLSRIVSDLLLLSEAEEESLLEKSETDIAEIVRESAAQFSRRLSEKGLSLELNLAENLPRVRGDRFLLGQVFTNLLDNAVKYTESGGIQVTAKASENRVTVRVEDTGIGIPEEHYPRLFERFYTVDRSRSRKLGGTGLGLSIVKHIVQGHGGEVRAEAAKTGGTAFVVTLPAALRA